METQRKPVEANMCALFAGLLAPPPTADEIASLSSPCPQKLRQLMPRSFLVNTDAGNKLCSFLEPTSFMSLDDDAKAQMLSLIHVGLRAGICSVVRLRLSCDGDKLVWRLLDLLKEISSLYSDAICSQCGGLTRVLGQVLGMVGSAGVGVDELKGLLRELRTPSAMTPLLVEALATMASPSGSPLLGRLARHEASTSSHFGPIPPTFRRIELFNFNGKGAGLALPAVSWPFPQEYQFAAWVRVDPSAQSMYAAATATGGDKSKPHLFTFTSEAGSGIDYYLENSRLFVSVGGGKGTGDLQPKVVEVIGMEFDKGKWHALLIWHKRSSTLLFNKDQLEVYLDGELVYSAPVPYPRHIEATPLTNCSIGWDLDGQMSGAFIFSGAAEPKVVMSMLKRLVGDVEDSKEEQIPSTTDPDLWKDPAIASSQERLERNLIRGKCRFFATFLPGRTLKRTCLEPHNGHHAQLRGNHTHVWIRRSVQDVMRSVGGAAALLPLAHGLFSDSSPNRTSIFIGQNVDTVLSILLSFLKGNVTNLRETLGTGCVEILELLLRSSPKKNFTQAGAHTVMTLEGIFRACRLDHVSVEASGVGRHLERGANHVFGRLVANFPLWVRAPPEFQFGLATCILDIFREIPGLLGQVASVEGTLSNIRICCPDDLVDDSERTFDEGGGSASESANAKRGSPVAKRPVIMSSLNRRERLHMRGYLWQMVRLLLEREVSQDAGDSLAQFVASCDDRRLVCELLQVLGSLMRQFLPPAGIFSALENAALLNQGSGRGWRAMRPEMPQPAIGGFLALLMQRCVSADGASEDLRGAGLRAANVFMARSAKAYEGSRKDYRGSPGFEARIARLGDSMQMKVSSIFAVLSEGLKRNRHLLGEPTYRGLLEMCLLGDEREIAWSKQANALALVDTAHTRAAQIGLSGSASKVRERAGEIINQNEELVDEIAAHVWRNHEAYSADSGGDRGSGKDCNEVLDYAQPIRNTPPLALILQFLPTMANSVQVRSHGDLLTILKLNEANRQKILSISHADGGRFWGSWQRCLFIMMAPLFSRHGSNNKVGRSSDDDAYREDGGNYFLVLKVFSILLEHMMSFDEGYKEIALAASLQPLVLHGRMAARILMAQLAFEVGQQPSHPYPPNISGDGAAANDPNGEEIYEQQRRRWDNIIHLAFIAANLVSDDVSTITAGLFHENVENLPPRGSNEGDDDDDTSLPQDDEAMGASAASTCIPYLLYSNPPEHGSVALAARVLKLFDVTANESPAAHLRLCASSSTVAGQGPLMFPLLRLSLFLLENLHLFSKPALANLCRLDSLVAFLLSDAWQEHSGDQAASSDDMCIVILAHVHAALVRLKGKAIALGDVSHFFEERDAREIGSTLLKVGNVTIAREVGQALRGLLRRIVGRRPDLLIRRVGERITNALQDAVYEHRSFTRSGDSCMDDSQRGLGSLLESLTWMEGNESLFVPVEKDATRSTQGVPALLDACMTSLKAAEELESRAVRASGVRAQQLLERVNKKIKANPRSEDGLMGNQVVEALRQGAVKTAVLREMETERRLLNSRQRLQRYRLTLSAAWSPWATRSGRQGCHEPPGWEISCHKDQRMRQMLLAPVDVDVGHKDASYAGDQDTTQAKPGDHSEILPTLKASTSLHGGDEDFVDDDEEEEAGGDGHSHGDGDGDELWSSRHEMGLSGWEDVNRYATQQAEIEEAVHLASIGQTVVRDSNPTPVAKSPPSLRPDNEYVFQGLRGRWHTTNVLREGSVPGTLYLFDETLVFQGSSSVDTDKNCEAGLTWLTQFAGQTWRWRLERLVQVHLRRYLLSPQAVELFWADSAEVFLAFGDVNDRQGFTRSLRNRNLPLLPTIAQQGILHPGQVLKASRITELWRRRRISNFQYIMELNVIAGRSYNDITQYPVFPWVLSDYSSCELDLNNPNSFRDLSKPIGALNDSRREAFMQRYTSFDDDTVPKFMYGSHYSSAGVVLHYHVRQDPFTTLHINLQGGRFDCPDRMFYDVGQCWSGCIDSSNMSDVKELTPEFFYCPEIFLNSNKLPLGEMQEDKGAVDDVRLPPWAKDAYDFVRIHRLALESEYVSRHLHHWIDLIFGYKQRGHEAVKAANVFYYLTYEGAVDLTQVTDDRERDAMEAQIRHFGQTPSQLLTEPHPVRLPPEECVLPLFSATSTLASLRAFSVKRKPRESHQGAALLVYCTNDRLVCVNASLRVTTWAWSRRPNGQGLPFTLGICRSNLINSRSLHMSNAAARMPAVGSCQGVTRPQSDIHPLLSASYMGRVHSCFGLRTATDSAPEAILSCGYWDHVVRLHYLDSSVRLPLGGWGSGGHEDGITCLCIADGGSLLVTGGQDATCRVWVVGNTPMAAALGGLRGQSGHSSGTMSGDYMVCVHVLYGHEAPLTCLAVSEELDAVVSGARDGRIILHCLKDGCYVRQYFCSSDVGGGKDYLAPEPSQLTFSYHGDVVVHSWTDLSLHRFSINGARLASTEVPTAFSCLVTAGGGEYLLAGGNDGLIRVYTLHDLCAVHIIDLQDHGGVTCMRLSPNDEYLLAGSEDGNVSIITDARKRLRMLDLALRRAFVG